MDLSDLNDDQLADEWHKAHAFIDAMEQALQRDAFYANAKAKIEAIKKIATQRLEDSGASSIATPHGTIHTVSKTTARVTDPDLFWDLVLETQNRDLLDLKANMTTCRHIIEKGMPVPGVELSTFRKLSITAPKPPLKRLEDVK